MKKSLALMMFVLSFGLTAAAQQTATTTLTLVITAPVVITTTNLPACTVGVLCTFTITGAGGTQPYAYSFPNNVAPGGAAIGKTTGIFTWTPTASGSTSISFMVADTKGKTATKQFIITVNPGTVTPPLVIPAQTLPGGVVGTPYLTSTGTAVTLMATGGVSPLKWALTTGTLPAGLSFASTGMLSGTPTSAANASLTFTVTDSSGATASLNLIFMASSVTAAHSVTVTWTNSTTSGVTGYNVLWANVSGGPYTQLNGGPVNIQPFLHANLPAGQQECYTVKAIGSNGTISPVSNESCVVTPTP